MTQAPITVTYSLEDVLGQLSQKLDRMDTKFEAIQKNMDTKFEIMQKNVDAKFETMQKNMDTKLETMQKNMDAKFETMQKNMDTKLETLDTKFETLQKDVVELKVGQVRLESEIKGEIKSLTTEVNGIGKRLDMQEFINRSVVVGFVVAVLAGVVKLFLPIVTSS